MSEPNLLYVADRQGWRTWLQDHYASASEVWLVYPRRHSGKPRIAYNDAVEEALCFGWIDSITKTIDHENYSQRFTPRQTGSTYAQTNRERLRRLIPQGLVLPEIVTVVKPILDEPFVFPEDIIRALQANPDAWKNFNRYSDAYRRIRVAYVDVARRRPGEFDKRLRNLIEKSAKNKQFGFGIESYY